MVVFREHFSVVNETTVLYPTNVKFPVRFIQFLLPSRALPRNMKMTVCLHDVAIETLSTARVLVKKKILAVNLLNRRGFLLAKFPTE